MQTFQPFDAALLKKTLRKHADIFLILLGIGTACTSVGGLFLFYVEGFLAFCFGVLFASVGLGLLMFNLRSTYSSVGYYYSQGLLNKHGIELQATLQHKQQKDTLVTNSSNPNTENAIERDLIITFSYTYQNKVYESEAFIAQQHLFDALHAGETFPILILPQRPHINRLRLKKIALRIQSNNTSSAQVVSLPTSQPLLAEDE